MALLKGTVNPLNVVGQRRLSYIPDHFGKLSITDTKNSESIDKWVYHNLNSRYCVRIAQGLDEQKKLIDICEIGIEDKRELTMLSLACPLLHNKK